MACGGLRGGRQTLDDGSDVGEEEEVAGPVVREVTGDNRSREATKKPKKSPRPVMAAPLLAAGGLSRVRGTPSGLPLTFVDPCRGPPCLYSRLLKENNDIRRLQDAGPAPLGIDQARERMATSFEDCDCCTPVPRVPIIINHPPSPPPS